jgi:hypothetical protein
MDDIVKQAMAKWPNVPYCYGWLALDARGNWRMRDERAQQLKLSGDKIVHAALLAFITRNYTHDARGAWFFQNGPQRVYVTLEAAPFIARTDGQGGLQLHTGQPLDDIDEAYMTPAGEVFLRHGEIVAQLDDRDGAELIAALEIDGLADSDENLIAWLEAGAGKLALRHGPQSIPVQRIAPGEVPGRLGFIREPQQAQQQQQQQQQ